MVVCLHQVHKIYDVEKSLKALGTAVIQGILMASPLESMRAQIDW